MLLQRTRTAASLSRLEEEYPWPTLHPMPIVHPTFLIRPHSEVLWDPCLLSPHVFLPGVSFANRGFETPSLTSAEKLSRLDIHPGEKELPLPLREDLHETFVFRRAIKTLLGCVMSAENLPYGTVAYWIRVIRMLNGYKLDSISYNLSAE